MIVQSCNNSPYYFSLTKPTAMWTPLDLLSTETWILLISLLALTRYYIHRKWQYLHSINIPHDPPSIWKLGHLLELFGENAFTRDNKMKKKYGPIWGSYAGLSPGITIHDPDILRQIFIKEFSSFPVRQRRLTKTNGKELSTALTAVEGNQWKRIRSSISPIFSTAKLRQMMHIMDRCMDNAIAALERKIEHNDGEFNPKTIFSRISLDMICSAAFSTEVNTQDDSVKEPEIAEKAKKLFSGSILNPFILLCFIFPPFEKFLAYFDISLFPRGPVEYFKGLTQHIINQTKEESDLETGRVDLMQLMLANEISEKDAKSENLDKGMDRTEIVGNSLLMILAGYENTGNTMSFLAYNLAQHPDIQKKLQDEIDEMMKSHGQFDYDSVSGLKYLDMCVNETLRLYNPIYRNARICDKEVTINGLTIPKGININIPPYALSHDPEYWDKPEEFNPERMRDMTQIDPIVFQPFGAGPRNCIGMRFALMELKISLAKLLFGYTLEPTKDTPEPPLKLKFAISIRPVVDYNLRVLRRNKED